MKYYKKIEKLKNRNYTVKMNEKELEEKRKLVDAFNLVIDFLKDENKTYIQDFMDFDIEDMKKRDQFCASWLEASKKDIEEIIKRTQISNKLKKGETHIKVEKIISKK